MLSVIGRILPCSLTDIEEDMELADLSFTSESVL